MAIAWTNDLNTGIDVIDDQHKRIVDYINQLETAMVKSSTLTVGQVLDELVDYTMSHFAFEESMQEEAGYQFLKPHKAIHGVFVKRVADFQNRYKAGESIAEELHHMLSIWLVHHIKRDDMAYVAEVKNSLHLHDKKVGGWLSRSLEKFFK